MMIARFSLQTVFPFLQWMALLNRRTQRGDFIAGITSAIIVLPQGIAFAAIAGLPPEYGLYSAIVPAVVAALFGSSYHLISGPTTAISLVVFAKVSQLSDPLSPQYIKMVLTLTFMAGVFQMALGLLRMGAVVNFISHSVVVGFTFGAAILIGTSQLGHFFGICIPGGKSFLHTWMALFEMLPQVNFYALAVSLAALVTAMLVKIFRPRWPGMLFGMMAGSVLAVALGAQSHGLVLMGALPSKLPPLSVPDFSFDSIQTLIPGALAIAMLGLAEAASIASSIANRSGQRLDSNQEFIGQGLSNIVGSFFSSYASSGSFSRSGVNYEAGAKTPAAAVYAGLLLAALMILIAPLTAYLPMAAMAGILMLVAYNLIDLHHIKKIFRTSRQEAMVLAITFFSTLFVQLEFALFSGVMLSLLMYLLRTSRPNMTILCSQFDPCGNSQILYSCAITSPECPQIKMIRLDGSIFFGAANYISKQIQNLTQQYSEQCHILVICSSINFIDVSGCEMLAREGHSLYLDGRRLYLCELKGEVLEVLNRGHYTELGKIGVFESVEEAVAGIIPTVDPERCGQCTFRLFDSCPSKAITSYGCEPNI